MTDQSPIMQLRGVRKTFGTSVFALKGVDLDIARGMVHGLLGSNGAGKSTLIKILSGSFPASAGEIIWQGKPIAWTGPRQANEMGVATIHQHIPLVRSLSVIENVFLGSRGFWRDDETLRQRFHVLRERVGYHLDPDTLVGSLSIGARQMVAIFQALGTGADLIVMDEPTASLAAEEREIVYQTVRTLSRKENKAVLFVSHFLDEIVSLTDQVTVLRDGVAVMRSETSELNEAKIAEAIVGKEIKAMERATFDRGSERYLAKPHETLLKIRKVELPGRLKPIDLDIKAGEVIGVAGLLGSGRSELLHCIFGAEANRKGEVQLEGKPLSKSTSAAVKAGIALVPEDRFAQGLVPDFEIWRNATLPALNKVSFFDFLLDRKREVHVGEESIRRLAIKAHSPHVAVNTLSGGNAQKVTISKWLFSDVKVFLLDEPTAGIDIGAKTDILMLVRRLADAGKAIIIVSSEFEELLAVSDRILVLRDGQLIAEVPASETCEHDLVLLAGGRSAQNSHSAA
ncbi:sugar ABC transporter ATP-binding protein [Ensifer sp. ENS07]|uniref:sugar ABC transporter ATP-binding protein n=1 Tax=Ensifer sp. ENS07 TaxID=2769274 RepID=UPI00178730A9|nr:sugar ABC transporter ATP-binding protein [Ensifer sp. ENS07]MBD9638830.1 sugar ABC transporter ATP-binding protein [Ensifer sp. ENS07]